MKILLAVKIGVSEHYESGRDVDVHGPDYERGRMIETSKIGSWFDTAAEANSLTV